MSWTGWALAHLEFVVSVNLIPTKGVVDYAHRIACPPGFENLTTSLNYLQIYLNSVTVMAHYCIFQKVGFTVSFTNSDLQPFFAQHARTSHTWRPPSFYGGCTMHPHLLNFRKKLVGTRPSRYLQPLRTGNKFGLDFLIFFNDSILLL